MYTVISGADGSGKTTVVRLLASYFSSQGSICTHWCLGVLIYLHLSSTGSSPALGLFEVTVTPTMGFVFQ